MVQRDGYNRLRESLDLNSSVAPRSAVRLNGRTRTPDQLDFDSTLRAETKPQDERVKPLRVCFQLLDIDRQFLGCRDETHHKTKPH